MYESSDSSSLEPPLGQPDAFDELRFVMTF